MAGTAALNRVPAAPTVIIANVAVIIRFIPELSNNRLATKQVSLLRACSSWFDSREPNTDVTNTNFGTHFTPQLPMCQALDTLAPLSSP